MNKILKKLSGIIFMVALIAIWCIYSYEQDNSSILTSSSILSNTKIGWGVKRAENHEQPDLRKKKCRTNAKI